MERIRPAPQEIEDLAVRETKLETAGAFRPICAGPVAAFAILAFAGLAAIPLSLWRILRPPRRTNGY